MESLGIDIKTNGIAFSPALRKEDTHITYAIKNKGYTLKVQITKEKGQLCHNEIAKMYVDGKETKTMFVTDFNDKATHTIKIEY